MKRILIDVGHKITKIMTASWKNANITVEACCQIDSSRWFSSGALTDIRAMADDIADVVYIKKYVPAAEIAVALPSDLGYYAMLTIENTSKRNLKEKVLREMKSISESKGISSTNTVLDWSYTGKSVLNQTQTTTYVHMSTVPKVIVDSILREFKRVKMSVKNITTSVQALIDVSMLYCGDYAHINKMYIDFGAETIKIAVQSEGAVIDLRECAVGYSMIVDGLKKYGISERDAVSVLLGVKRPNDVNLTDEDVAIVVDNVLSIIKREIKSVVEEYETKNKSITKIIQLKHFSDGSNDIYSFLYQDMKIETVDTANIANSGYMVSSKNQSVTEAYNGCIGILMGLLDSEKHINLLIKEYKENQIGQLMTKGTAVLCTGLLLTTVLGYGFTKIQEMQISRLERKSDEYAKIQEEIKNLNAQIDNDTKLLNELKSDVFPFSRFIADIRNFKTEDLHIISMDSEEQLNQSVSTPEPADGGIIQASDNNTAVSIQKPSYSRDLKNRKIIVRIYSSDQSRISGFVYNISQLDYISDCELTAIEEHEMNGIKVNICEFIITL